MPYFPPFPALRWHYTTGDLLDYILRDGAIRAYRSHPEWHEEFDPSERPIVWFSANQDCEPSLYHHGALGAGVGTPKVSEIAAGLRSQGGLARIGVDAESAPRPWRKFKFDLGWTAERIGLCDALECRRDWYASFASVDFWHWSRVERFSESSKSWVSVPIMDSIYRRPAFRDLSMPMQEGMFRVPNGWLAEAKLGNYPVASLWQRKIAPALEARLPLGESPVHGYEHARRVGLFAEILAWQYGADMFAAVVAAYCHDCARENDGPDPGHGARSWQRCAGVLRDLFPGLPMKALRLAIEDHSLGSTTQAPLIASLWDADRIDLMRLGYELDPLRFSRPEALRLADLMRSVDLGFAARICGGTPAARGDAAQGL
jgi:uncharacterized protein